MSRFFNGVEFPELEKVPELTREKSSDTFPDDFQPYLTEFNKFLSAIEAGTSAISRAVSLEKSTVRTALTRLANDPNASNLKSFLLAAEQDVNRRFKLELITILIQNKKVEKFINEKMAEVVR